MKNEDIIRMAREAGFTDYYPERLTRFAALVAAHVTEALTKSHEAAFQSYVDQAKADRELEALAARLDEREKQTNQEPTTIFSEWFSKVGSGLIDDLPAKHFAWKVWEAAILAEREACAKECVKVALRFFKACDDLEQFGADECAAAIRARGEK